ncbi:LPP20 family lipoprotein [Simiduia aestuariiviva]|uniref:LPP20 lipoprotein n=1 Tax=Simiduia aestuariiviva TaxID=1510459 RepID=A0A839UMN9_9GAMM|nr:LPP20 family lipoprotein [Simiduia aestuariiviva]MBB3168031.1 hypothetical protein [Simiduia aestuariiviva]
MNLLKCLSIGLVIASLAACSSNPNKSTTNTKLPDWVTMPNIEDGLAESACVPFSGQFTIDRDQATALARNNLVQQIEIKAASLTKTFAHKTDTKDGSNVGANFETSARQIAEATLRGTKAERADIFELNKQQQLCVLVTLRDQSLDIIADQIATQSGATLSSDDKRVIAEELKAKKGQQELQRAIDN